jgi:regulator of sirC expression with transglutaminase-like and TPR domain
MKQKEEGTQIRHFGAAAKEIAAGRSQRKSVAPREAAVASFPASLDPVRERTKTRKLYEAFRDARQTTGESTRQMTTEAFQEFLRRKMSELREKSGDGKVEFVVSIENGRTRLKARVQSTAKVKV